MIDVMGFESFTFKKLAHEISSTEASIYRYFENKHRLLVYLIAWYWNWLEYRIDYGTHNINSPYDRLDIALKLVSECKEQDPQFPEIDEAALYRIVIAESDKTYLTKHVDVDNKEGLFRGFKSLCKKIADIVKEINPEFKYSHALMSTILQASHQQIYYAQHLPSLTEVKYKDSDYHHEVFKFLQTIVRQSIKSNSDKV
jgi:AcrR family transcriptional regulator